MAPFPPSLGWSLGGEEGVTEQDLRRDKKGGVGGVGPLERHKGEGCQVSSVQLLSHVWLFATPWTAAHQASRPSPNSWSLLKFMSPKSVMSSNHLILCRLLLLLVSIFPSIGTFLMGQVLHIRWPKYWSFSISPSSGYSGLISFRIDCFNLLSAPGTLKSLL